MRWDEFAAVAPELAALGEERLKARELCLVGTLRRNGWPRITPVEPEFVDGELMLGMMWRSPKALDLLRDPRLVVHCVVSRASGRGRLQALRTGCPGGGSATGGRATARRQGPDRLGARGTELPRVRGRHRLGRLRRASPGAATDSPGTRPAVSVAGSSVSPNVATRPLVARLRRLAPRRAAAALAGARRRLRRRRPRRAPRCERASTRSASTRTPPPGAAAHPRASRRRELASAASTRSAR